VQQDPVEQPVALAALALTDKKASRVLLVVRELQVRKDLPVRPDSLGLVDLQGAPGSKELRVRVERLVVMA